MDFFFKVLLQSICGIGISQDFSPTSREIEKTVLEMSLNPFLSFLFYFKIFIYSTEIRLGERAIYRGKRKP